jgi:hypothetical protein
MKSSDQTLWIRHKAPMENLLDLFLYICKDLDMDYEKSRNSWRLSAGSLKVTLEVTIDKFDLHEVLEIRKTWDPAAGEHIVYVMDYMEPHIFQAHERERMKSDPREDWVYQAHLAAKDKNRFLSKEMFVDNLKIAKAPDCKIEYATDNLGRGLRTLASLNLSDERLSDDLFRDILYQVYRSMLREAGDQLKKLLGEDSRRWRAAIRRGTADVRIPFSHMIGRVFPPWCHGRELVRLCRYFAKTEIH